MPTVLRIGPYRFFFYSNGNSEPAHVHVRSGEKEAKFWLSPVRLTFNHGYRIRELTEIESLVVQYRNALLEAWDEYFT
jgi:hypothetical protein